MLGVRLTVDCHLSGGWLMQLVSFKIHIKINITKPQCYIYIPSADASLLVYMFIMMMMMTCAPAYPYSSYITTMHTITRVANSLYNGMKQQLKIKLIYHIFGYTC